mmetsp:Transcript_27301/g.64798  ORF Transcript_27301/g.64798 Transcript_27301/m.64798 type:complete len:357 (+) Transcript_27301:79-1149(+)
MATVNELEITAPDDFHLHVRDGDMLKAVLPHTARLFQRAIIMPNLVPPVSTLQLAQEYRKRVVDAVPAGATFEPLMTLYLTHKTTPEMIREAAAEGTVKAVKWYPAGATTNSGDGVKETEMESVLPTLTAMAEVGMPLLCHGESTDQSVDMFDREATWVRQVLRPLVALLPNLKIVMEHVTTKEGVEFVLNARAGVAGTITVQHLLFNRNALFAYQGKVGLRPHHFCLPILKREEHRQALLAAVASGSSKLFAGTDSAPHPQNAKENPCGCAGCFTAGAALELYAEALEEAGALDKLEAFVSHHGADFYGIPRNTRKVKLLRAPWTLPDTFEVAGPALSLVPLRAGTQIPWTATLL